MSWVISLGFFFVALLVGILEEQKRKRGYEKEYTSFFG